MKLVIIESPYAGHISRNEAYARMCLLHSLRLGEAPIASHLLYTQVLDDDIQTERERGINAGLAWRAVAERTAVYTDFGITNGMMYGIKLAEEAGIEVAYRHLLGDPV